MKSPHTGIKRVFYAGYYSYKGLRATWQEEAAFRQELLLFAALIPVAIWLAQSLGDFVLLVGVLLVVMVVELLNSALETVVDRIDPDYHPLAGRAKDQASAAVLISILLALLVWGSYLWGRISEWLFAT